MIKIDLKSLTHFFKSQGLLCEKVSASSKSPFDYLFVYMGEEEKDDQSVLQIRLSKQVVEEDSQMEFPLNPKGYYHFQFTWPIKIALKDPAIVDLSRLIQLVNLTCNLPGFEFSEVDKALFYRYTMIISGEELDPYVLITIVGSILLVITAFSDYLKDVASESKTFTQVVDEIKKINHLQ